MRSAYTPVPVLLLLISLSGLLVACTDKPQWSYVELPKPGDKTIRLKVAYVDNPRFSSLSKQQIAAILERTRQNVKTHFQLDVTFSKVDTLPIESFFNNLKQNVKRERSNNIAAITELSSFDRFRLRESVYKTLESYWNDREVVIDFARPYLVTELVEDDFKKLSDALIETLQTRLTFWYEQNADDGRPILDGSPYNEWVWWDSLGYGNVPYDVVLTNQLVASAEFYGMDVHSSLRGGISAGTTTYSRSAQFDAFSWIMVYPMLNDNAILDTLRDDKHYDEAQITEYSAALLTHELGHLLLHLGHPFGNHNCIMSPTPLLLYRKWVSELNADMCPLNSEEQMTPGVARIEYREDW